jgi:hypothetical protein
MSKRLVVEALPTGPHDPLLSTPPRRPGSVRRTTTIDQRRGARGVPEQVIARGRDLLTRLDGTAVVLDEAGFDATVEAGMGSHALILTMGSDPPEPVLEALVGASAGKGLRGRIDELLPEHRAGARVLHQLLDDLPMAGLISSYGSSREKPEFKLPGGTADRMTDLCAGWIHDGTMLTALDETGLFPIPRGMPITALLEPEEDPLGWHELPPRPPRTIRRRRRLDLAPGPTPDAPLELDVHFRDSELDADGVEHALHEYTLTVTIEPGTLVVLSCEPRARVLPWPECPGSLASAARIVGDPVAILRSKVAVKLTGVSTCTHLNDTLRSMSSVTALAAGLAAGLG